MISQDDGVYFYKYQYDYNGIDRIMNREEHKPRWLDGMTPLYPTKEKALQSIEHLNLLSSRDVNHTIRNIKLCFVPLIVLGEE